jgi:hypothetical protein
MTPPASLRELQAWLQAAISEPRGVLASAGEAEIEQQVTPSGKLTSAQRLGVYQNAYFARLVDCLGEMLPAVKQTIGDEAFAELAMAYLVRHPSQSYTLNRLGDAFVTFVRETRPPRDSDEPDWADFLADLARMELAIDEVFDGPGHEGEAPPGPELFASIPPERVAEVRFQLTPSLLVLAFEFPINDFYSHFRAGEEEPLPLPAPTYLALFRRDYVVRRLPLALGEHALLAALAAGEKLGEALVVSELPPESLFPLFRDWTAVGIIRGVAI